MNFHQPLFKLFLLKVLKQDKFLVIIPERGQGPKTKRFFFIDYGLSSQFIITINSYAFFTACLYFAMIAKVWLNFCLRLKSLYFLQLFYPNTTNFSAIF